MRELHQALSAMGYREVSEGKWAKPVGFHLFTFNEKTDTWQNWYKCVSGSIEPYISQGIARDDALSYEALVQVIANFEAYTRISVGGHKPTDFYLSPASIYW